MGQVHATPHFEITSGPKEDLTASSGGSGKSGGSSQGVSTAGVGSVGNIPGPSNTTEAVVGVVVPGLIASKKPASFILYNNPPMQSCKPSFAGSVAINFVRAKNFVPVVVRQHK